jgi:hypothetical protein
MLQNDEDELIQSENFQNKKDLERKIFLNTKAENRKKGRIQTRGVTLDKIEKERIFNLEMIELDKLNQNFIDCLLNENIEEIELLNSKFVDSLEKRSKQLLKSNNSLEKEKKILNGFNNKFVASLLKNIKNNNNNNSNSSNDNNCVNKEYSKFDNSEDKLNFHKHYEEQTNFQCCGLCSVESGLDKMRIIDDKVLMFLESLNTNVKLSDTMNSYIADGVSSSFIESFNNNEILFNVKFGILMYLKIYFLAC